MMSDPTHEAVVKDPSAKAGRRFDHLLHRLGLRTSTGRDFALGVVVGVLTLVALWASLPVLEAVEVVSIPSTTTIALSLVLAAQSLVLGLRRRHPIPCLLAVTLLQVPIVALLPVGFDFQGPAVLVAAYTCGTLLSQSRLSIVLAVCVLVHGVAGGALTGALSPVMAQPLLPEQSALVTWSASLLSGVPMFLLPGLVGAYVGTRRRFVELTRVRAQEEVRAQRERARAAIRTERTHMARELHDIAAHHLSGMVVQAGAAERLIGHDDQAAREAVAWVRAQGKETLSGLRAVVGTLRDPEDEGASREGEAPDAPVPGLDALERLVSTERGLGTDLRLTREGRPYELPPIADVTAYRTVQEALANARDHAAGAGVRIRSRYRPERFVLEVENEAGGAGDTDREHRGLGLLGMRERADVVGARLDVGPTADGGWLVRWEIAVEREESR